MAKRDDPFPEGSDTVLSKGPCPVCGRAKSNVTYEDLHEKCFGAGCTHKKRSPLTHKRGDGEGRDGGAGPDASHGPAVGERDAPARRAGGSNPAAALIDPAEHPGAYGDLGKRRLKGSTLRRYGYFTGRFKGGLVQVSPYFDMAGELAAQKLRMEGKDFPVLKVEGAPSIGKCQLFGRPVYGDRYDRRVVVTEGELDAMSVGQAVDFKFACVSVNTGAQGAVECLKANYLWLDRFDEIVLWFDDDEAGHAATEECAKLFKVGKVKIAKAGAPHKDASDLMQANLPGDIAAAVYAAVAWRPKGIVNAKDNASDVTAPKADEETGWSFNWPWAPVQDYLGPMRPGQVCYHVAGTGIGKTTGIAEIEYDLLKQGCKLAHMGFEDTRRDVKLRLLSIHVSDRLDVEPRADDEMIAIHEDLFGSGLVELFDPETAEWTVEAILGYVRYCAKALDCRVIVVDPLTFIAAGLSLGDDERRTLDKVSRDLAALAKELGVHIQVTHHLNRPDGTAHEEGAQTSLNQVRGSGGIANFATFVIGHERNQQAEGSAAFVTQLRSLKNRPRSRTGPMISLAYNMSTGRLEPTKETFPGPTKGGRRGGSGRNDPFPSEDY